MARARDPVTAYAERVRDRKIVACKWHRLACERHCRDVARNLDPDFPYYFDKREAQDVIDFAQEFQHFKGEWAGQFIKLERWEKFILGSLFGWKRKADHLRRFRVGYVETPRGQGKSTLTAIIGLKLAFFDGEPSADVFSAATKRDQAKIVWEYARRMVMASPELSSRIWTGKMALARESDGSRFLPLGADADTTDGLRPHGGLIDELHAHKTGDLVGVIETGMGTRRQPLLFEITTAGDDVQSVCFQHHEYVCRILERIFDDETWFGFITTIDDTDDWTTEAAWKKANPNFGISVKVDDLKRKCETALKMPSAQSEFKRKHLNIWVNAANPWLSMDGWRKGQSLWNADELLHQSCWVGVDLASQIDLCAMVFVFPPTDDRKTWRLLRWVWTPKDTLLERARRDRAPYDVWNAQGKLLTVDGVRINHTVIRDVLKEQRERYRIEQIGFDPWHADQVVDELIEQDGFSREQVILVPQTYAGMSKAALDFEAAVLEGIVDANDCPLMAWCASNVVVQRDGKDNIYPVKKRSRGRIDPIIATIIGWRLAELGKTTQRKKKARRPMMWTPDGFVPVVTEDSQPATV